MSFPFQYHPHYPPTEPPWSPIQAMSIQPYLPSASVQAVHGSVSQQLSAPPPAYPGANYSSRHGHVYAQHTCIACGVIRSSRYHHTHPVAPGNIPAPAMCRKCRNKRTSSEERKHSYSEQRSHTIGEQYALRDQPKRHRRHLRKGGLDGSVQINISKALEDSSSSSSSDESEEEYSRYMRYDRRGRSGSRSSFRSFSRSRSRSRGGLMRLDYDSSADHFPRSRHRSRSRTRIDIESDDEFRRSRSRCRSRVSVDLRRPSRSQSRSRSRLHVDYGSEAAPRFGRRVSFDSDRSPHSRSVSRSRITIDSENEDPYHHRRGRSRSRVRVDLESDGGRRSPRNTVYVIDRPERKHHESPYEESSFRRYYSRSESVGRPGLFRRRSSRRKEEDFEEAFSSRGKRRRFSRARRLIAAHPRAYRYGRFDGVDGLDEGAYGYEVGEASQQDRYRDLPSPSDARALPASGRELVQNDLRSGIGSAVQVRYLRAPLRGANIDGDGGHDAATEEDNTGKGMERRRLAYDEMILHGYRIVSAPPLRRVAGFPSAASPGAGAAAIATREHER
ncbi:MAG: hypothetical protein M1819_004641 [Sarea resinae]|nr:MAG: hypothetical protein M1819_004641 [Sarea resinae]